MSTSEASLRDSAALQAIYYAAGIAFLALAKLKYLTQGYLTPKVVGADDVAGCVSYDRRIAQIFLQHVDVQGKRVLELGPGSDLGVGILLVQAGARGYVGVDRNPLVSERSAAVHAALGGVVEGVRYEVVPDFQFAAKLGQGEFDVIVSNAAFEHFDDVPDVARQLATVVKPGGKLSVHIDLKTHSRWIRDKDPANIYRYPGWLYRLFYFPGQPNRLRPADYRRAFTAAGWKNVRTSPVDRTSRVGTVHGAFDPSDMDQMTVLLEADR
ncbi:MAG: class I SAM-dependent methyltransferase [Proteobacteria bacterium]|nr:class I SAM-dependent methyltransferase [Pseudomonadota bacterium]